ncbi:hypothetical protein [Nitrospira sp. Kam-Ns4a]
MHRGTCADGPAEFLGRIADEFRCECGQLMARWLQEGIQLKCKRCRRLVVIPFSEIGGVPPRLLRSEHIARIEEAPR